MAGRQNLYDEFVKNRLDEIPQWIKEGLTERQIAEQKLGIAYTTFNKYKQKYTDLTDAIKKGRIQLEDNLENSLYKIAMGFSYEETKTRVTENPDGSESSFTEVTTKYQAPNPGALIFALKNLNRERWKNNPAEYDLKQKELENKQKISKMNNF